MFLPMSAKILTVLTVLAAHSTAAPLAATCNNGFNKISAADWVTKSSPGWNLGNTLDAIPTEGSWNNAPVQPETFAQIKKAGFKGMRLPVTWADHFVSGSPDWTVNSTWLQRVSDVVDESIAKGFYTLVNVHHDASSWANVAASGANYSAIEEQFYSLWYQIGTTLACKSSLLAFETINEPGATTQDQYDEINKLNAIFVKAINDAGGYNPDRVLTLVGPSEDGSQTSLYFKRPANLTNPWAIQVRSMMACSVAS
jgi:endoglucanase